MQYTAKIIRHRHEVMHFINGRLITNDENSEFKIVFSHPHEFILFEKWVEKAGGKYDYDKDKSVQNGTLPEKIEDLFDIVVCWCDIMTYYLLHVAGYTFHSTISPYKGEVYVKVGPS